MDAVARVGSLEEVLLAEDVDRRRLVLVGRGTNTGRYQGQAFSSDEWITDVFVRGADGWRCAHTHLTAARGAS